MINRVSKFYGMNQARKLSYFEYYTFSYGEALPKYKPSSLPSQY